MNTKTRALEAGQNVAQLPLPRIGGWKSRRSDTCEPLAVSAEEQSQPTPNQTPTQQDRESRVGRPEHNLAYRPTTVAFTLQLPATG